MNFCNSMRKNVALEQSSEAFDIRMSLLRNGRYMYRFATQKMYLNFHMMKKNMNLSQIHLRNQARQKEGCEKSFQLKPNLQQMTQKYHRVLNWKSSHPQLQVRVVTIRTMSQLGREVHDQTGLLHVREKQKENHQQSRKKIAQARIARWKNTKDLQELPKRNRIELDLEDRSQLRHRYHRVKRKETQSQKESMDANVKEIPVLRTLVA